MKSQIIERLKSHPVPEEFNRERVFQLCAQGLLGETARPIREIQEILESEELAQIVLEGRLTLAMIRPELTAAVLPDKAHLSDTAILEQIKLDIQPPLQEVFSISMPFTDQMIEEWYQGGPKSGQTAVPPIDSNRYGIQHANRWDEFKSLMVRGASTFVLLYSEDGQAVERWRRQMGNHWNVFKLREERSDALRARYAKDVHNTIFHGSDSRESALREIHLLARYLGKLT
jgi:nucleoside diphosphate kinase